LVAPGKQGTSMIDSILMDEVEDGVYMVPGSD
jgi:hypothetical protein